MRRLLPVVLFWVVIIAVVLISAVELLSNPNVGRSECRYSIEGWSDYKLIYHGDHTTEYHNPTGNIYIEVECTH